jgi:RNA polymerase sigma factor (sigma-70 family)
LEESRTSPTLLGRLRESPTDGAAWGSFVARYGPPTLLWCRKRGLQHADAEDVTQEILVRLARSLRSFSYDPSRSFRGWLRRVSQRALSEYFGALASEQRGSGDSVVLEIVGSVEARGDLLARLEAEFDLELLDEAMARVRLRVEPATWEAFKASAMDGLSGTETASRLGLNLTTVYKARSRVQAMIRDELAILDPPLPTKYGIDHEG